MDTILFICTHNSSRSILAEALVNHSTTNYRGFSAGTAVTHVNPFTIKVLQEHGIETEGLHSKDINQFINRKFDYVVTVCDSAKETCPFFPAIKKVIHAPFPDPSTLGSTDQEKLEIYRSTLNVIARWLNQEFGINFDLENH